MTRQDRFLGLYAHFNPVLIVFQIVSNQLLFYTGLVFFYGVFDFCFGVMPHSGQFFDSTQFCLDHTYGVISLLVNILNTCLFIAGMIFVIEKANKVMDFVFTTYFVHTLICVIYNRTIWLGWEWIFYTTIFVAVSVVLGEYVLLRLEQQEIKLFENLLNPAVKKKDKKKDEVEMPSRADGFDIKNMHVESLDTEAGEINSRKNT